MFGPVGVLGLAQLVAQLDEFGDVGLGGFRIAGAGGAEGAREMCHRLDLRQTGSAAPRAPPPLFQSPRSTA